MDLIDSDLTPNPYNPHIGDIYGREPGAVSDGLPLRVVVLAPAAEGDDGSMVVLEDGREATIASLPMYLASIAGIRPLGRVRTEVP